MIILCKPFPVRNSSIPIIIHAHKYVLSISFKDMNCSIKLSLNTNRAKFQRPTHFCCCSDIGFFSSSMLHASRMASAHKKMLVYLSPYITQYCPRGLRRTEPHIICSGTRGKKHKLYKQTTTFRLYNEHMLIHGMYFFLKKLWISW